MNDVEYEHTQAGLFLLAAMARSYDFAGMLNRISRANSLGPILNPTLYRQGAARLDVIETLAESAFNFRRAAEKALIDLQAIEQREGAPT